MNKQEVLLSSKNIEQAITLDKFTYETTAWNKCVDFKYKGNKYTLKFWWDSEGYDYLCDKNWDALPAELRGNIHELMSALDSVTYSNESKRVR